MNEKEVKDLIHEASEKHRLGGYSAQATANGWPIIFAKELRKILNGLTDINENIKTVVQNTEICAEHMKSISAQLKKTQGSKGIIETVAQNIIACMRNHQDISEATLNEIISANSVQRRAEQDDRPKQDAIQATPRNKSRRRQKDSNRTDSGADS